MVRRDGVSETQEAVSPLNILDLGRFRLQSLEKRRVMDVRRRIFPLELFVERHFHGIPAVGAFGDFGVDLFELVGLQELGTVVTGFLARGPDILQENSLAVTALTDGLLVEVDVDGTCQGVGHD